MDHITPPPPTANGTPCRLYPAHLAELAASGLTQETAKAAGIYSESDQRKLAAMMNRKAWSRKMGGAIVFPYRDSSGAIVLNRLKPDNPPLINGKPAKYLSPSGGGVRVYFPPVTHERIEAGAVEIIITEGEKKSLALSQAGFCTIGLSGVECWHRKKSNSLLPELEAISWRGRKVFIVFDSDAVSNCNVKDNESLLAAALELQGAKVLVVRLPSDGDNKVGADDFLVKHGPGEFKKLLDSAEPPDPVDPETIRQPAKDADPAIVAEHILSGCRIDGKLTMRFYRGEFLRWENGCWQSVPSEEIRAKVTKRFTEKWFDVKGRHISDVLEHIKSRTILSGSIKSPAWLSAMPDGFKPAECLCTMSQIIHLPTGRIIPATQDFFNKSATDFELDCEAPRPEAWLGMLADQWGDDPDSINTLQEWFGYLLTPDTSLQKGLMIVGPRRSSKGTINTVAGWLVGEQNVTSPRLSSLGSNFGLWPLVDKSLATIGDARLSGRADINLVTESLLTIIGEDSVTVDRKCLSPITTRLPTRFMVLSNELPRFTDASGTIVSRFIFLRTTKSFLGNEDRMLKEKIKAELPGILLWSIGGWKRLNERGHFLQPDSCLEHLAEMHNMASPISQFVREFCIVESAEVVEKELLFKAWESWCQKHGREKYTGNTAGFAQQLYAAVTGVIPGRLGERGSRVYVFKGIGLKGDNW